jgi:hypothetical protein
MKSAAIEATASSPQAIYFPVLQYRIVKNKGSSQMKRIYIFITQRLLHNKYEILLVPNQMN